MVYKTSKQLLEIAGKLYRNLITQGLTNSEIVMVIALMQDCDIYLSIKNQIKQHGKPHPEQE